MALLNPRNETERQREAALQVRRAMRLERIWVPRINRSLRTTGREMAEGYQQDGFLGWEIPLQAHQAAMTEIIRKIHVQTFVDTRAAAMREKSARRRMERKRDVELPDDDGALHDLPEDFLADPALREYWYDYVRPGIAEKVVGISNTTKGIAEMVVEHAVAEGYGVGKTASLLSERMGGKYAYNRARVIAQTEIHSAQQTANYMSVDQISGDLGIATLEKEWVAVNDERTRQSHRGMDGTRIPQDEFFRVPNAQGGIDLMQYPGDPNGSASNVINCRCATVWHDNIPLGEDE